VRLGPVGQRFIVVFANNLYLFFWQIYKGRISDHGELANGNKNKIILTDCGGRFYCTFDVSDSPLWPKLHQPANYSRTILE
jgi:hypothetical protein